MVVAALVGAGGYLLGRGEQPTQRETAAPVGRGPTEARGEGATDETLSFFIREGAIDNHFFRRGAVAGHVVVHGGEHPRVLFAFPAGNSGAAMWLAPPSGTAQAELELTDELAPVERDDGMRGLSAEILARATELTVERSLVGTIRMIRLFVERPDGSQMDASELPPEMIARRVDGPPVVWARTSLDGHHHYQLSLEPIEGTTVEHEGEALHLRAPEGARELRFRLTALTDEPPLTPIPMDELLDERAADDERTRNVLAFLTYDEKMLAGSWRFLTYFGRDTLLSLRLLMPVLEPRAIEAGLGSVIERLGPEGQVAHEEDIAEQAALRNRALETPPEGLTEPHYDYKMIDDDVLFASVLATYLLDTEQGSERAERFLARRTRRGETYAEAIRRNLDMVLERARPFARSGAAGDLVATHEGEHVGQWRDSVEGLGGGKYPYDVNAILMPAALRATARLLRVPALTASPELASEAEHAAEAWGRAAGFFDVTIPRADAVRRLRAYAAEVGIPADPAIEALPDSVVFPALTLDASQRPIAVMHSDDGFELLFGEPSQSELEGIAQRITMPFPAGLRTPAGVVVANPAYLTSPELRSTFSSGHYHGTTVWSWQQAMLATGLRRQIERDDLSATTRQSLEAAEALLWEVIDATREMRTSELWTWAYDGQQREFRVVPFGQGGGHQAESNAAQLWSTVYLAVRPPTAEEGMP